MVHFFRAARQISSRSTTNPLRVRWRCGCVCVCLSAPSTPLSPISTFGLAPLLPLPGGPPVPARIPLPLLARDAAASASAPSTEALLLPSAFADAGSRVERLAAAGAAADACSAPSLAAATGSCQVALRCLSAAASPLAASMAAAAAAPLFAGGLFASPSRSEAVLRTSAALRKPAI